MPHILRTLVLLAGIAIAIAPCSFGQASAINGEITGTISDASGAAIPGATVEVTNTGTGFKQSAKTVDSGLYRFSLLPLGTYDLEVNAAGFAPVRRTGIVLNAGATAT